MNKTELQAIYFRFFDQLLPEHAEKSKANYDEDFTDGNEPVDHEDAIGDGFDWEDSPEGTAYWNDIHSSIVAETYNLQLTPQVCKDKAVAFMSTERMATQEDYDKLDRAAMLHTAPPTEPNFGTDKAILPTDSQARKQVPVYSGFMAYFPRSIAAVAHHSWRNNEKHNPGEPLRWSKEKSSDHMDCLGRHMLDQLDPNLNTIEEKTATAWRAMADLETALENL